ncbi:hypothetical protein GCM10027443_06190 [Pontibacter brevis]
MKLTGNIRQIRNSRDSRNSDVAVHLNTVEYITHKKDGKYYQPFDFVDELDTPLILTGDCLSLANAKQVAEGEYEFNVYDKVGDEYEFNENKLLTLTLDYDYDAGITILTEATYTVTVSNEEFKQIKDERNKARKKKQGKGRRSN